MLRDNDRIKAGSRAEDVYLEFPTTNKAQSYAACPPHLSLQSKVMLYHYRPVRSRLPVKQLNSSSSDGNRPCRRLMTALSEDLVSSFTTGGEQKYMHHRWYVNQVGHRDSSSTHDKPSLTPSAVSRCGRYDPFTFTSWLATWSPYLTPWEDP